MLFAGFLMRRTFPTTTGRKATLSRESTVTYVPTSSQVIKQVLSVVNGEVSGSDSSAVNSDWGGISQCQKVLSIVDVEVSCKAGTVSSEWGGIRQ